MKKLKVSLILVVSVYIVLFVLSFIFYSHVNFSFIGKWGLIAGLILLIGALPIHRITYYGGSGIAGYQSIGMPRDEHVNYKIQRQYEREQERKSNNQFQDILGITGILLIVISLFIIWYS